jgi:hypothetical protein
VTAGGAAFWLYAFSTVQPILVDRRFDWRGRFSSSKGAFSMRNTVLAVAAAAALAASALPSGAMARGGGGGGMHGGGGGGMHGGAPMGGGGGAFFRGGGGFARPGFGGPIGGGNFAAGNFAGRGNFGFNRPGFGGRFAFRGRPFRGRFFGPGFGLYAYTGSYCDWPYAYPYYDYYDYDYCSPGYGPAGWDYGPDWGW